MKLIPLGKSNKFAIIDDEDFEKVNYLKWYLCGRRYAHCYPGWILLHRYILNVTDRNIHVDHKDDNGLNCQKENLRLCSNQQNTSNKRNLVPHTSQYKGVSWEKRVQKWRVTLTNHYKQIHIGTFNDEIHAAQAYNKKAIEVFGEFARLNEV